MDKYPRIIDRDIEFYQGDIEYNRYRLARCYPSDEHYWSERIAASQQVVKALDAYRRLIDQEKNHASP